MIITIMSLIIIILSLLLIHAYDKNETLQYELKWQEITISDLKSRIVHLDSQKRILSEKLVKE